MASRRRYVSALVLVALGALTACGCSPSADTASAGKVDVATTTTQLTDFAKVIGGDHVAVHGLLKANVDPHDYEPSPADLDEISTAKVIVKNGVGLDKWFDDTIKAADPSGQVVDASRGVAIRRGTGSESKVGDPHIWHDPRNAEIMVNNIERALVKADPAHRADYQRNLDAYRAKLLQLDRYIATGVGSLSNKKLVTNHDAFGYFVRRYGLEFEGSIIPSFDTSAQLSGTDVSDLVTKIKATGTKAVFSESSLPPKTAAAIGREANVRVVAGSDSLYGDTLGPPGSAGDTYLKMERHNADVIVDNLR